MVVAARVPAINRDNVRGLVREEVAAAAKRPRFTLTPVQTVREQGQQVLVNSDVCGAQLVDALLAEMPNAEVMAAAVLSMQQQLEKTPAVGNKEDPVQQLVHSLFSNLHDGFVPAGHPAMLIWDTHQKGLTVSDSSLRAKPDLLLCDTYAEAANVVTVVEAKSTLNDPHHYQDVAFQLRQRMEQLYWSQPRRAFWVMAAVGTQYVEIWRMDQVSVFNVSSARMPHVRACYIITLASRCFMMVSFGRGPMACLAGQPARQVGHQASLIWHKVLQFERSCIWQSCMSNPLDTSSGACISYVCYVAELCWVISDSFGMCTLSVKVPAACVLPTSYNLSVRIAL